MGFPSDLEIAQAAPLDSLVSIAAQMGTSAGMVSRGLLPGLAMSQRLSRASAMAAP